MGVLPKTICEMFEECLEGCLVTRNPDWVISCQQDMFVCQSLANRHRACVWDGQQYGGKNI